MVHCTKAQCDSVYRIAHCCAVQFTGEGVHTFKVTVLGRRRSFRWPCGTATDVLVVRQITALKAGEVLEDNICSVFNVPNLKWL